MHRIDSIAYASPLRPISSMWKCGFAAILLIIAYTAHPIVQGLVFLWMTIWTLSYAKVPKRMYMLLLGAPFVFFLTSMPAMLIEWTPASEVIHGSLAEGMRLFNLFHGTVYISNIGVHRALLLAVRLAAALSCFYFLILTTPFSALLQVLARLKIPHIVLELMLITYRFIFLLYDTAVSIRMAQQSRGGHAAFRRTMQDLGMLFTRLFAKTMERYRGLALGLTSRGFEQQIHLAPYQPGIIGRRYVLESSFGVILLLVIQVLLWKGGW